MRLASKGMVLASKGIEQGSDSIEGFHSAGFYKPYTPTWFHNERNIPNSCY